MSGVGGGPCDYFVSPSPFALDFGTLNFGTLDSGLTKDKSKQQFNCSPKAVLILVYVFSVLSLKHSLA